MIYSSKADEPEVQESESADAEAGPSSGDKEANEDEIDEGERVILSALSFTSLGAVFPSGFRVVAPLALQA